MSFSRLNRIGKEPEEWAQARECQSEKKTMKKTLLLVDDEPNSLKVLSSVLKKEGFATHTALDAESAWKVFTENAVHGVITDLKLPGKSGLDLLEWVKVAEPDMPVIMITAYGSIENAVQAMKLGAYNYLTKPVNPDELLLLVNSALEHSSLEKENVELRRQLQSSVSMGNMVGKSKSMQEIFNLVAKVAEYGSNILVSGETGTGKELVARAIHSSGAQSTPFVTIDCAAIPETLLESELFGHVKGAFTGATESKKGQIEQAHGGTLFLDEVGELPLTLQKKFLRFLQNKEFVRVGCTRRRTVDVRIIAATNKNLEQEVQSGTWREDLFYRLNVIQVELPPLRERKEDIPLLVSHFLNKYNALNKKAVLGVSSQVAETFDMYDWPGNVRELENVVERGVVLCSGDRISQSCLPPHLARIETEENRSGELNLLDMEKDIITRALDREDWNQSAAARALGISRKQLRTKMGHHGLL